MLSRAYDNRNFSIIAFAWFKNVSSFMAVTIKDISRQAAVSIATVSMVLNGDYSKVSEDTRDRILKVADELNYRPNLGAFRAIREHKLKVPRISPWLGLTIYTFPPPWSQTYHGEATR